MPLAEVVVFVKIGCQLAGKARSVVAQIRVVAFGNPTKVKVMLPLMFLTMLLTTGITTVSDAKLLVVLPMKLVITTE